MLLTILTRTFQRPTLLKRNQDSLAMQTCQDYQQELLEDTKGLGAGGSGILLQKKIVKGDYVWVLDDDDYIIGGGYIGHSGRHAAQLAPCVSAQQRGIFPPLEPVCTDQPLSLAGPRGGEGAPGRQTSRGCRSMQLLVSAHSRKGSTSGRL